MGREEMEIEGKYRSGVINYPACLHWTWTRKQIIEGAVGMRLIKGSDIVNMLEAWYERKAIWAAIDSGSGAIDIPYRGQYYFLREVLYRLGKHQHQRCIYCEAKLTRPDRSRGCCAYDDDGTMRPNTGKFTVGLVCSEECRKLVWLRNDRVKARRKKRIKQWQNWNRAASPLRQLKAELRKALCSQQTESRPASTSTTSSPQ